jgi:hypothetical protein
MEIALAAARPERNDIRPPLSALASITSATPSGRLWGSRKWTSPPTTKPAADGGEQNLPPLEDIGVGKQALGPGPVQNSLHQGDQLAEQDHGATGKGAGEQRQEHQNQVVVADQAPEPGKNGGVYDHNKTPAPA